jgi:topoisomerase-4 subunit A
MPRQLEVEAILRRNTDRLVNNLQRELSIELERLEEKWHARKLEQIFIEERLYKQIEEKVNYKAVISTVRQALAPYAEELRRKLTSEDVERLLEIKIRRISRYDINRQEKELLEIEKALAKIREHLTDMIRFTTGYIEALIVKYGPLFPRKSELRAFDEIDARAAALSNLNVFYTRENGFIGHKIKAEEAGSDLECCCSEYDRLLLIFKDGLYKVINVPDKLFVGPDLHWMGVVKNDLVFNLIYRGADNLAYVKRFAMPKFILNREYHLFDAGKRAAILLLLLGKEGLRVRASLAPSSRAKYNALEIDLDDYQIKGANAKGKRIANRTVRRITDITGSPKKPKISPLDLPGFTSQKKED